MSRVRPARILLAGVRSEVGKTLIALGLAYELRRRNLGVAVAVTGPNLLQSVLFKRTTARYVRCLDESILVPAQVQAGLAQASIGADVVLIDGRNGLYDGVTPGSLRTSDAEIAALTGAPVVLVVDTRGFGSSLTALIRGFGEFAADFTLAGTLLNRVSLSDAPDAPNTDFYATGLQIAGMEPPLGGVPELGPAAAVLPPAGITEQENLTSLPRQFFVDLSHAVSRTIDIERLLACAGGALSSRCPTTCFARCRDEPGSRWQRTRALTSVSKIISTSSGFTVPRSCHFPPLRIVRFRGESAGSTSRVDVSASMRRS